MCAFLRGLDIYDTTVSNYSSPARAWRQQNDRGVLWIKCKYGECGLLKWKKINIITPIAVMKQQKNILPQGKDAWVLIQPWLVTDHPLGQINLLCVIPSLVSAPVFVLDYIAGVAESKRATPSADMLCLTSMNRIFISFRKLKAIRPPTKESTSRNEALTTELGKHPLPTGIL